MSITEILKEIGFEIFIIILGLFITAICRKSIYMKLKSTYRRILYYLFNKSVRIKVFYKQKYKEKPEKWLSNSIFEKIKKKVETDKLLKRGIHKKCISLYSDNLGHTILIWLEEELDSATFGDGNPKTIGYNVTVEIKDEIRLGRRDFDELDSFTSIATNALGVIESNCLPRGIDFFQKFAVCKIRRDFDTLEKEIHKINDEKLNAEISISENNVHIILSELSYLEKTIKKYFYK